MGILDPAGTLQQLVEGQVDMGKLAQLILEKFGGLEGLSNKLHDNYETDNLHDGSRTRVQILDHILKLLERLAEGTIFLGVFGATDKTSYVVPNKIFEGMMLGRPVVTAEAPAMDEIFTPGEHYVAVPPGDAARLAEALLKLVDSPAECERISRAGLERVQQAFLPQHIGAQLKPILEALVNR